MLNDGILLLCLINFGYIALLPRKFFKQGARLSGQFWLTAAPLFASPAFLGLGYFGVLPPFVPLDNPVANLFSLFGVICATISILLLGLAIGTHRVPLHMFHDQTDRKVSHLVTFGPYRYIRHPIYSSYLFALAAALLVLPQYGTLACYIYGLLMLSRTAAKEEARLCQAPELGEEYRDYMRHTGRFVPPLGAFTLSSKQHGLSARAGESSPRQTSVSGSHSSD